MAIFRFFKMAAAAILDFWNLKVLTVWTVNSVELRHRAIYRQNRSKRGRDIAIYRFFKMAAAAILDFESFKFLTVGRSRGSNCIIMPNFVTIGQTAVEIRLFLGVRPLLVLPLITSILGPICAAHQLFYRQISPLNKLRLLNDEILLEKLSTANILVGRSGKCAKFRHNRSSCGLVSFNIVLVWL